MKKDTLRKRDWRKRRKDRALNGTPEEKALIKKQDDARKYKRWQKECKWIPRVKLLMSIAKADVLVTRKVVTPRSTQQRTARQKSAERARVNRDNIVNGEVNNFFQKILREHNDIGKIAEEATEKFVWYPKLREVLEDDNKKQRNSNKPEEVTIYYQPTETELHKWITVKKSTLQKQEGDNTEGYGVFSERNFSFGDHVAIYLGHYVESTTDSNLYSLQQTIAGTKEKKIITTGGGFPRVRKMYLGAHMMNDFYWPVNKPADEDKDHNNNVQFSSDLSVITLRKITAGEELFVSYNIEGTLG